MNSPDADYELEHQGPVLVWWFGQNFSQSRYGDRTNGKTVKNRFEFPNFRFRSFPAPGSNACTLIAVLVALRISQSDMKISGGHDCCAQTPLSSQLIKCLADSFVQGNKIHERLLKSGELPHVNMSVPEAIQAAGKSMRSIIEWKSLVYLMDMGSSLFDQLNETVQEWYRNPPPNHSDNLFVIIIADNRSVLLTFQHTVEKVTLIDSHQHLNRGAVVAQVDLQKLGSLCAWYLGLMKHCYNVRPSCYELSYLYFRRYDGGEMILC
ncbi:uncharacterized protein [Neodiprion pinetum]|uniref:Uncharacterized protein LOC107223022 isoform X1 n=1 Tax=Neodiprion lecontei TaxID=441921 RepID=A0ABM3G5Q8_NEOLC|nr:uncharacterized protein LOC124220693 isoform X1 [Neodiprion pinetum]XP_046595599.1 uncharacterized protein LOC107223022 isoform X1 [Neodiprion lecontei]